MSVETFCLNFSLCKDELAMCSLPLNSRSDPLVFYYTYMYFNGDKVYHFISVSVTRILSTTQHLGPLFPSREVEGTCKVLRDLTGSTTMRVSGGKG